jgi:hypothetical protein
VSPAEMTKGRNALLAGGLVVLVAAGGLLPLFLTRSGGSRVCHTTAPDMIAKYRVLGGSGDGTALSTTG